MQKWCSVLIAVLVLACAAVVLGQESQPQSGETAATFHSAAGLVLVPVTVTDAKGAAVHGLGRDAFQVSEDGATQKIAVFEEIKSSAVPVRRPEAKPNFYTNEVLDATTPRNLTIVAFDLINTRFTDQKSARDGILSYLRKAVRPDQLVALLVIRRDKVEVIHDFTSDTALLIAALNKVGVGVGRHASNVAESTEHPAEAIGNSNEEALANAVVSGDVTSNNPNFANVVNALVNLNLASQLVGFSDLNQDIRATLEAFQHIANGYAVVPGRKSLIWATGSFPFRVTTMPGEITGGIRPEEYERTMQMLNAANIAVYPVDVRGLIPSAVDTRQGIELNRPTNLNPNIAVRSQALEAAGTTNDPDARRADTHASLRAFADMTGGEAFMNENNLSDLFARAAADSEDYYLVGYYRTGKTKPGWRKLKVAVAAPQVRLHYRSGYFYTPALDNPQQAREMDDLVAVTSPLNYTSLPMAAIWQPLEGKGSKKKAGFTIFVAGDVLTIDAAHNNHVDMDFIAVAFKPDGSRADQISQHYTGDLKPDAVAQIRQHNFAYQNALQLPNGEYHVRMVVRDNLTGRIGSVTAPLTVQ